MGFTMTTSVNDIKDDFLPGIGEMDGIPTMDEFQQSHLSPTDRLHLQWAQAGWIWDRTPEESDGIDIGGMKLVLITRPETLRTSLVTVKKARELYGEILWRTATAADVERDKKRLAQDMALIRELTGAPATRRFTVDVGPSYPENVRAFNRVFGGNPRRMEWDEVLILVAALAVVVGFGIIYLL